MSAEPLMTDDEIARELAARAWEGWRAGRHALDVDSEPDRRAFEAWWLERSEQNLENLQRLAHGLDPVALPSLTVERAAFTLSERKALRALLLLDEQGATPEVRLVTWANAGGMVIESGSISYLAAWLLGRRGLVMRVGRRVALTPVGQVAARENRALA